MSYARTGLAGPLDSVLSKVGTALEAGKAILEDPALPQVTSYVLELKSIQTKRAGAGGAPSKGIGLTDIVTPVKYYVAYQKNRWIAPVALLAIIGLPFFLGYTMGKKRRGS